MRRGRRTVRLTRLACCSADTRGWMPASLRAAVATTGIPSRVSRAAVSTRGAARPVRSCMVRARTMGRSYRAACSTRARERRRLRASATTSSSSGGAASRARCTESSASPWGCSRLATPGVSTSTMGACWWSSGMRSRRCHRRCPLERTGTRRPRRKSFELSDTVPCQARSPQRRWNRVVLPAWRLPSSITSRAARSGPSPSGLPARRWRRPEPWGPRPSRLPPESSPRFVPWGQELAWGGGLDAVGIC